MANPKKPALRLRVGRTYVDRIGHKVRIVRTASPGKCGPWRYVGDNAEFYRLDGTWGYRLGVPATRDLIREASEPKPATARKAAPAVMAWGVARAGAPPIGWWTERKNAERYAVLCSGKVRVIRVKIVEVRR